MSDRASDAWALHKAPHVAESLTRNIAAGRLTRETHVVDNWRIGTFVVLGSGHTLPDDLRGKGMGVGGESSWGSIAVNSSLQACLRRGRVPAYAVCRESIDMTSCFAGLGAGHPRVLMDANASHVTWGNLKSQGLDVSWFLPAMLQNFWLARAVGVTPVYAGQSSVTAAIALAEYMGATTIVLAGCTRAFARDGSAYAKGAQWDKVRLVDVETVTEPDGQVHHVGVIEGREAQAALHEASGQRPPLKRERVVKQKRLDGTDAWSLEGLADGKVWMENFARRHPHVRCVQLNAEDDIPLVGWEGGLPAESGTTPGQAALPSVVAAQCDTAKEIADATLDSGRVVNASNLLDQCGPWLLDFIGKRKAIRQAMGKSPQRAIPPMLHAQMESAERIKGMVIG